MAWANLDPFAQERQARRKKQQEDLLSVDPVSRYRAREREFQGTFYEMGMITC